MLLLILLLCVRQISGNGIEDEFHRLSEENDASNNLHLLGIYQKTIHSYSYRDLNSGKPIHISAWFVLVFVPICLVVGLIAVYGVKFFTQEDVELNVEVLNCRGQITELVSEMQSLKTELLRSKEISRINTEDK